MKRKQAGDDFGVDPSSYLQKVAKGDPGAQKMEDEEYLPETVDDTKDDDGEGGYMAGVAVPMDVADTDPIVVDNMDTNAAFKALAVTPTKINGLTNGVLVPKIGNPKTQSNANSVAALAIKSNALPLRAAEAGTSDANPGETGSPFYLCGADLNLITSSDTQVALEDGDFSNWIARHMWTQDPYLTPKSDRSLLSSQLIMATLP